MSISLKVELLVQKVRIVLEGKYWIGENCGSYSTVEYDDVKQYTIDSIFYNK